MGLGPRPWADPVVLLQLTQRHGALHRAVRREKVQGRFPVVALVCLVHVRLRPCQHSSGALVPQQAHGGSFEEASPGNGGWGRVGGGSGAGEHADAGGGSLGEGERGGVRGREGGEECRMWGSEAGGGDREDER